MSVTANLCELQTPSSDAQKVLDWAKAQNPNAVVVLLLNPGTVTIKHSSLVGINNVIGALERAKFELLSLE